MTVTKRAMFGRRVAAIRCRTLIINLPGSPGAAEECFGFLIDDLHRGIAVLQDDAGECAR